MYINVRYNIIVTDIQIMLQTLLEINQINIDKMIHTIAGQTVVASVIKNLLVACFSVIIVLSLFSILIHNSFCIAVWPVFDRV